MKHSNTLPSASTAGSRRGLAACTLASMLLAGCALLQKPAPAPAPTPAQAAAKTPGKPAAAPAVVERHETPPPEPAPGAAQLALNAGIDAYNRGEYQTAIRKLGAPEIAAADKATQLSALKYSAFSYCLTRRQTLCRQQFGKAFKLDPAFDLAAGEKGHPLWEPAFDAAKKTAQPKK